MPHEMEWELFAPSTIATTNLLLNVHHKRLEHCTHATMKGIQMKVLDAQVLSKM